MTTSAPDPNTVVWFREQFVPLRDAHVNVLTHGLNYGTGVFEGIRGYWDADQRELFLNRAEDHYRRWKHNTGILRLRVEPSAAELCAITAELCRRNQFHCNIYVRPIAYKSAERIGVHADDQDEWAIVAVPYGEYFAGAAGLKAGVVSWRRVDDNAIPGRAKICGAYVNSVLAGGEARDNGHDEAIFLTQDGHVCEGSAANIFMVRDGRLLTPPVTDNILEGITRASVMELAQQELGLEVTERSIDRSELYICDELFYVGTAVEVASITHVDHRPVGTGEPGAITRQLRALYGDAVRGRIAAYRHWLWPAFGGGAAPAQDRVQAEAVRA